MGLQGAHAGADRRRQPDAPDAHRGAAEGEDGAGLFEGAVLEAGTKTFEERKEIDWHWSWEILLRRKLEVRAEKERALAYLQVSDLAEVGNEAPPEHLRSNKRWYHNKVNPGSRELSTRPGNLDSASVAREGTGRLKEAVGGRSGRRGLRMSCRAAATGPSRTFSESSGILVHVFGSIPHTFGLVGLW